MKQLKLRKIDFTGNNIYIGIDVHLKKWYATIMTKEFELATKAFEPDVEKFKSYLDRNYPNAKVEVAYEAGYSGYWIHDNFNELGIECKVLNPADIPTTDKERKRKTDPSDSRKIAKLLKSGLARGIYVPDKSSRALRELVRHRQTQIKEQTRAKNRVKSFITFNGIKTPDEISDAKKYWSKKYILWLRSLKFEEPGTQIAFNNLLDNLDFNIMKVKEITRSVVDIIRGEKYKDIYKILITVPGIGAVIAATLIAELIDINRFEDFDHLLGYIGLVPNMHSSGNHQRTGHITRRGNGYLKSKIIEASWTAVRKDPALTEYFLQTKKRMKETRAIIRIARKLVARIRYIWINKIPYEKLVA